ncbi:MAG: hypothetical protein KAT15_16145, partial [Bacteroidales bacterium]|nr:hypothetical protein [Bacteroidales bacterium]
NNHKRDDFKPYVMKSADKGKTWSAIANNLPENGSVWSIEQDFVNPDLLFVGTEFGMHFSIDGGKEWVELKSGLPPIAVRDIVFQERENDLVIATFGRGFYILDDLTPLRALKKEMLKQDAVIFPVKDAKMFIKTGGKYGQGSNFYVSENPEYGATFTYYIKDVPKTLKEERQEKEKELFKNKKPIPQPGVEELREENKEIAPYLVFSIRDASGREIQKLTANAAKGIKRITWNLRYPSLRPVSTSTAKFTPVAKKSSGRRRGMTGMMAMPGNFSVSLSMVTRDGVKKLTEDVPFKAEALNLATLPAENRVELVAFQEKVTELASTMNAAENFAADLQKKVVLIKQTLHNTAGTSQNLMNKAFEIEQKLENIIFIFEGAEARASSEEIPPSAMPFNRRLMSIVYASMSTSSGTTQTQLDNYEILKEEFPPVLDDLKSIQQMITELNDELDAIGAPWTPGRVPSLQ